MNSIKQSLRFLKKFSAYALLNIVGITIAILIAISGVLFFTIQMSYDNFHDDYVYRVHLGKESSAAKVFPALAEKLEINFSSIKEATRLKRTTLTAQYQKKRISDIKAYYVDENFFEVFNYQIILGNKEGLKNPNTVLISESLVKKFADNASALVGETLLVPRKNGYESYSIEGILKDIPSNSHLKFDILISYSSLDEGKPTFQYGWAFKGVDTYIKTANPLKLTNEESNLFLSEIKAGTHNNSIRLDETLEFIPISEVHYLKNMIPDEKYGDKTQNMALLILFIILLITLVFNFYGSSLILSHFKSKSLKLKKIFGASSNRILLEKLTENSVILIISVLIAWIIFLLNTDFFLRTFNISQQIIFESQNIVLISLLVVCIIFVVIPGFQTYFYSRKIDLKGKLVVTRNIKNPFSKIVMIQITISLIMIIVSAGVYKQVKYIEGKNNLIETKNVIVVDPPHQKNENYQHFFIKNEIRKFSFIKNVALSNTVPFNDYAQLWWGVKFNGTENFENEYAVIDTDIDFFEVYKIDIIKGIKEQNKNDVFVNEKFVNKFLPDTDIENIVGQQIVLRNDTLKIAGVVEDYYHLSSKNSILPSVYRNQSSDHTFLSVKFNSKVTADEISKIKELWNSAYPDELFTYHILTDGFEKIVYEDMRLLSIGSLLALSVCVLSLLALIVTISIDLFKRQKEFVIRRIIGASKLSNIKMVYKEYLVGILIACIISMPLSGSILNYVLSNYIEKTDIPPLIFVTPCLFFLLTTLVMILFMYNYNEHNISLSEELNQ